MKRIIILLLAVCSMFITHAQTFVEDSTSQFELPLSSGSFVFDKGTGQVYQILEQAEATDSLVSVNRKLSSIDTLSILWRNDISDSISSVGGFSSTALTSDVNITGNYNVTFGHGDVFDDEARLTSFQVFTENETATWPWRSQFSMKKDEMPYLRQFQPSSPGGAYVGEHTFTGYGEPVLASYRANFTPTNDSIVFGVNQIGAYLYDHDRGEKLIIETDRITLAGDHNYISIDTNKLVPKKYVDRLVADSIQTLRDEIHTGNYDTGGYDTEIFHCLNLGTVTGTIGHTYIYEEKSDNTDGESTTTGYTTYEDGELIPFFTVDSIEIVEICVVAANMSVSQSVVGSGVNLLLDFYSVEADGRTLLSSVEVPVDSSLVSANGSGALNGLVKGKKVLSLGDVSIPSCSMWGVEINLRNTDNTCINGFSKIQVALKGKLIE